MLTLDAIIDEWKDLPKESRVWIFQSDHLLDENLKTTISSEFTPFISSWKAHNQSLEARFALIYDYFLVIVVNESTANASGCSIDALTNKIKEIGDKVSIDFFQRLNTVLLRQNNRVEMIRESAAAKSFTQIKVQDYQTFNNTVNSLEGLQSNWLIPLKESWQLDYFQDINQPSFEL